MKDLKPWEIIGLIYIAYAIFLFMIAWALSKDKKPKKGDKR
tara:strand:- start:17369 stop:17491 length:123 start_codon:yes stop_codon:yes gene_type:complete